MTPLYLQPRTEAEAERLAGEINEALTRAIALIGNEIARLQVRNAPYLMFRKDTPSCKEH